MEAIFIYFSIICIVRAIYLNIIEMYVYLKKLDQLLVILHINKFL